LQPVTTKIKKQGQAGSRRVKVVCRKCNNEWLSELEKRAKPLLLILMNGMPFTMGADAQRLLALWAAKTMMVAEFVDPTKVAIPETDRASLMQRFSAPESGWWIWIARSGAGPDWLTGINHFSARINRTPVDSKTPNIVNVQSSTIGIGQLLIHGVSTTVPGHSFALQNPDTADLRPIWPQPTADIVWPRSKLLNDDEINFIARTIPRAFGAST
jgi:hypothetical protein